jgi:hypothetical protein
MNKFGRIMCLIGCNNILKINGIIYVTVPNIINIMEKFILSTEEERKLLYVYLYGWNEFVGDIHSDGFTLEKLTKEFLSCGFEIINSSETTFPKHPYISIYAKKIQEIDESIIKEKFGNASVYNDGDKYLEYYNSWKELYLKGI